MTKSFKCPLWSGALSFEGGLKRRLCCHDETGSFEEFSGDLQEFSILDQVKESSDQDEIPQNCIGCVRSEKNSGDSPRLYYERFFSSSSYEDEKLKYLDITFENICNLSCFTCKPIYSNKIEREFIKLGIPFENEGLSAKNFKEKFESIKEYALGNLSENALVVISGGEPALSSNVKSFIEELSKLDQASTLTLRVFSNLTISIDWILDYIDKFQSIEFIISVDAIKSRAEYIRYPSKWKDIEENFNYLADKSIEYKNLHVSVHSVLSILNFDHVTSLIDYFYTSKLRLFPEFTVISSPKFYQIENLSQDMILETKNKVIEYLNGLDATPESLNKIRNFKSLINSLESSEKNFLMELLIHHKKIDKLRSTSLEKEIPYITKK